MKRNIPDFLRELTGLTCCRCGKQLVGWIAGKNADGSTIDLCNQCLMRLHWIDAAALSSKTMIHQVKKVPNPSPMYYYLDLDECTPKKCTFDEWLIFQDSPSHLIAQDYVYLVKIETRFCGFEPYYVEGNEPFIFETIVDGDQYQCETIKYCTYEDARKGHTMSCQIVRREYTTF